MNTIGVDIGGTKLKAGIIDQYGKIHDQIEQQTEKNSLIDQLLNVIQQILSYGDQNIQTIGIATAGRVDYENGSIFYATPNLPNWTGTKVKQIVEHQFHIPTVVDNDANCAAFAEMTLGAAKSYKNVACITLGTGVGAGMIINGQLFRGTRGGAGEFGHMIFEPNGRQCNCGKAGCWEQYVSGSALQWQISNNSILASLNTTPKTLFQLAVNSHPEAEKLVDQFIANLAIGLISIHNILELDCYVLGGGVIDSSQYWWTKLEDTLGTISEKPPLIKAASFKNNAGMIGASQLAINEL